MTLSSPTLLIRRQRPGSQQVPAPVALLPAHTSAWAFRTPEYVGLSLVFLTALTRVSTRCVLTAPTCEVPDARSCVCPPEWLC